MAQGVGAATAMCERVPAGPEDAPAQRCGATLEAIIRSFPGRVLTVTVLCARKRPLSFDSCAPAPAKRARGDAAAAAAPVRFLFSRDGPSRAPAARATAPAGVCACCGACC